jgi:hypothetical protein
MLRAAAIALCLFAGATAAAADPAQAHTHTQAPRCKRVIAADAATDGLKLVGLVARGNVRMALYMDANDLGHLVREGDCLGRARLPVHLHGLPLPPAAGDAPFVEPPRPRARPVRA